MIRYILISVLLLNSVIQLKAQSVFRGKVVSAAEEKPIPNATVKIKSTGLILKTDTNGNFVVQPMVFPEEISIHYIGYLSKKILISTGQTSTQTILLDVDERQLQEVNISTGYQEIKKERLTGSVFKLDSSIINRKVSTDILSRLEDVVPGLIFNKGKTAAITASGTNRLSIRGQSTIFSNTEPLIVVDNFPYNGDLSNINPNDVQDITILKDAAASAIWGAKSANGVIVIKTKKGRLKQPLQIKINSNFSLSNPNDLFYVSKMSSADYIEVERKLFAQGFYKNAESSANKSPLSPVIELLITKREQPQSAKVVDDAIEALKKIDIRNDFEKYYYQKPFNHQQSISLTGGGDIQRYYLSAGYDSNLQELKGNNYNRITLSSSNTWTLISGKLEITNNINFSDSRTTLNNTGPTSVVMTSSSPLYPYAKLTDDSGEPSVLTREYRKGYLQSVTDLNQGLLSWDYKPLEELNFADNTTNGTDYRIGVGLNYKVTKGFSFDVLYQYSKNRTEQRNLQNIQSWFTRNQINRITTVNTDGSLITPIPLGGILDMGTSSNKAQYLRGQINFKHNWSNTYNINAIAGYELSTANFSSNAYREYGYDEEHAISKPVNYTGNFISYVNPSSTTNKILNNDSQRLLYDRNLSYYTNAGITLKNKYTFSASARLDRSNIFGVATNQKGVPLYAAGLAWQITNEGFYNVSWLNMLKIRTTYGYNGNVFKSLSAYTTASYQSGTGTSTGLAFATVLNPPNPDLRWERVQTINFGLDFSAFANRLSGSFDYYHKKGKDLIGESMIPSSTGVVRFTGNTANTTGRGLELQLHSINLRKGLRWDTDFMFSYNQDHVTTYNFKTSAANYVRADNLSLGTYPLLGKPIHAIYSYRWGGLDPSTGDPLGYLEGQKSKDYTKLIINTKPEDLIYHGSSRPIQFGLVRNTFIYKNLELSANISYRLGYYFRRESVNYTTILNGNGGHGDYALRWQKQGDENTTQIPSLPSINNANRNNLYLYSSQLIERGDNFRLQEINLSYTFSKTEILKLPINQVQIYMYASNLLTIWKANRMGLDPDYLTGPPPINIAGGLRITL